MLIEATKGRLLQVSVAISASSLYLVAGLCIGWASPMIPRLMSEGSHIPVNEGESSWIVAMFSVGSVLGVFLLPFMTKTLGRKKMLIITTIVNSISWLIVIFATTIEALYVARFLFGMANVLSLVTVPVYLTETSEVAIRGILSSLPHFFYTVGVMIEYCTIPYISYTSVGVTSIIFPIISFFLLIFVPESPYFLLYNGREREAEESLMKLRGQIESHNVQEELATIKKATEQARNVKAAPVKDLFFIRGNRRSLIIVLTLVLLQHFCGQLAILSYATKILKNTSSSLNADTSVMILGSVQIIASVVMSSIVDRVGRRPLLISSLSGLSLSSLSMGIYFSLQTYTNQDLSPIYWLPITTLIFYMSSFSLALSILPFTILGEIIPINIKGITSSLTLFLHSITGILTTKLFQIMTDDTGPDSPFWLFLAFNVSGTIFIAWYVPETMGKTFTEIYEELNEDLYPRRTKNKPNCLKRY